jgi:hypothetical protein
LYSAVTSARVGVLERSRKAGEVVVSMRSARAGEVVVFMSSDRHEVPATSNVCMQVVNEAPEEEEAPAEEAPEEEAPAVWVMRSLPNQT